MPQEAEPLALDSVEKTLLLPLWGRAVESGRPRPLLVDPAAAAIVAALPYDFVAMARNLNPITRLSWIARSLQIDGTAHAFLERHPDAAIVNLGCGLDTTFERVDNGQVRWFDLDLPDVIALRRRLIPEGERRRCIAASVLDDSWRSRIQPHDQALVIAAGVLYYFSETEVRALLSGLAGVFPGAEMIFDACSPTQGSQQSGHRSRRHGRERKAQWGLSRAKEMEAWDPRIAVLEFLPDVSWNATRPDPRREGGKNPDRPGERCDDAGRTAPRRIARSRCARPSPRPRSEI